MLRELPVKRLKMSVVILIAAALVAFTASRPITAAKGGPVGSQPKYALTDLGDVGVAGGVAAIGNPDATGTMLVVGRTSTTNGGFVATVWEVSTAGVVLAVTDLPPLPGTVDSSASDVNDAGDIVGNCDKIPFVDVPGLGMLELPTTGAAGATASAINNHGEIVGVTYGATGAQTGALWSVDALGAMMGPLSLGSFHPADINDAGMMAGEQDNEAAIAAFDASMTLQVVKIGFLNAGDSASRAIAINTAGAIVGESFTPVTPLSEEIHAFSWTQAQGMVALTASGVAISIPGDVNDLGQVVGEFEPPGQILDSGFVWQNGKTTDLNKVLSTKFSGHISSARAINATGHIVANMNLRSGAYHACLLTPH
jgi:uncharacterized membrane protein